MNTFERLEEIMAKYLYVSSDLIKPESAFIDDLGFDSLDTVELVTMVEEEFGVMVEDDEAEKLRTVADAVKYIDRLMS